MYRFKYGRIGMTKEKEKTMVDWSNLNLDLLIEIAERLPSMESYEYFGGVCKSWQAAARKGKGHLSQKSFQGPVLMLAERDENNKEREFSSITLGLKKSIKIFLPEASRKRCVSCKDWLLISSLDEIDATLLHPFSHTHIHLPKLTTLSRYNVIEDSHFIGKMVLSANPATTSDFTVMVICGRELQLAFWKSGDTSWTSIELWKPFCQFFDIVYCNNKLYAVDVMFNIATCDIHGPNPTQLVQVFSNFPREVFACPRFDFIQRYLVKLVGGKFLMVCKCQVTETCQVTKDTSYHTVKFEVFEVNTEDDSWVKVEDLGNKSLFLGYNSSFSIECSEFNKYKPNSIYFSDDNPNLYLLPNNSEGIGGGKDMGIYHLFNGKIQRFSDDMVKSEFTPPTWFGPSF